MHINLDTTAGKIIVKTEAKDKNNQPLFEWTAQPNNGNVTSTIRQADGSREQIIMKNDGLQAFDLSSYKKEMKKVDAQKPEILNTSES